MKDNWEKEGFEYLEKIFGESLSLEEFEKNLETNTSKQFILSLFRNFLNYIGISSKLGKDFEQNLQLNMSLNIFLETISKSTTQFSEKNPDIVEQIENIMRNFAELFQSSNLYRELLSISSGNEFEDSLKKRFLEELERAEQVSKKEVAKSFKLGLDYVERQQQPDQLFILSSYNKLGIQSEELKTDTILNLILSFLNIILKKKEVLFKLSDDVLMDYLNEFVSRLGRAIESYLKVIIVSIYNLQKIDQGEGFDDFEKGIGYYLSFHSSLHIPHSEQENYIDYRNAINHNKFDVSFNRTSEEIVINFYLKRESKGRVYWHKTVEMGLNEFEKLFRDFRKFQNLFFFFYEVYIKSIDNNYKYQFSPFKYLFN